MTKGDYRNRFKSRALQTVFVSVIVGALLSVTFIVFDFMELAFLVGLFTLLLVSCINSISASREADRQRNLLRQILASQKKVETITSRAEWKNSELHSEIRQILSESTQHQEIKGLALEVSKLSEGYQIFMSDSAYSSENRNLRNLEIERFLALLAKPTLNQRGLNDA